MSFLFERCVSFHIHTHTHGEEGGIEGRDPGSQQQRAERGSENGSRKKRGKWVDGWTADKDEKREKREEILKGRWRQPSTPELILRQGGREGNA